MLIPTTELMETDSRPCVMLGLAMMAGGWGKVTVCFMTTSVDVGSMRGMTGGC